MLHDAKKGIDNELIVKSLEDAQRKEASGENLLDDEDRFFHEVICGRRAAIDLIFEAL